MKFDEFKCKLNVLGAISGSIGEGARALRGEEVTWKSIGKAVGIGAAAGALGGASTHLGSNISSKVSGQVGKAVTRISVQATTAAATDATLQYIDKGEIDTKQLLLNSAAQITVATTSEVSQNVSKRTESYSNKVNSEMIKESTNDKELQAKLEAGAKDVRALSDKFIDDSQQKAAEFDKAQKSNKLQIEGLRKDLEKLKLSSEDTKVQQKQVRRAINKLHKNTQQLKPPKIGDKNIHLLHGERANQIAVDINLDDATDKRGAHRAVYEKHDGTWVYADHTLDHNYDELKTNVQNLIPDPFDALRPEQFVLPDEEENDGDKKNN